MKLKKITLNNIRSYVDQSIDFPSGSTLLWGNIGSGKSTILLALDFALFGLQRGNLTGASLLRNGENFGFVQLEFQVDDENVVIFRTLKRTKSGVLQDVGFVSRNGVKEEKTAIELKQVILEILNYPKDLLTKNKSLIFRYTVYTPQEEMKSILLGPKEERLDTLRRVFGVEKYKRITDNAKIMATKIRERKKHHEGFIQDIEIKKLQLNSKMEELNLLENKIISLQPVLKVLKEDFSIKKVKILEIQKEKELSEEIKRELAMARTELKNIISNKASSKIRLEKLEIEIEKIQEDVKGIDETVIQKIQDRKLDYETNQKKLRHALNELQEMKTMVGHMNHLTLNIEKMQNCPTCFQEVNEDYKAKVRLNNNQEINLLRIKLNDKKLVVQQLENIVTDIKVELDILQREESKYQIAKIKIVQKGKKEEEKSQIEETFLDLKSEIGKINLLIVNLESQILKFSKLNELFLIEESKMKETEKLIREKEKDVHGLEISKKYKIDSIKELNHEIDNKNRSLLLKEKISKTLFWLTDYFVPLMDAMEKNILFKVHSDFNNLFEKWFAILMNNEDLKMSLDVDYSPKILQNGYDIEYQHLSGGEKTAGALAYRLGLNQVINSLNAGIKTSDLLILDEPTDGFSQEQIENLKSLMEEINIPQVIIVSHKPEIEAFVQNIVKIEKNHHFSQIII